MNSAARGSACPACHASCVNTREVVAGVSSRSSDRGGRATDCRRGPGARRWTRWRRANQGLNDLLQLPIRRAEHRHLVARCWELRRNLTPYEAAYVALAEALNVPLLTADERLSRAPGIRCQVQLIGVDRRSARPERRGSK